MGVSAGQARRLGPVALVCAICAVGVAVCVLLLPPPYDLQAADMASTTATFVVTAVLVATARRVHGEERRWRLLVALTAFGGFLISVLNSWHVLDHGVDVYNEIKTMHATFILAYLPALAGLLLLPSDPMPARVGPRSPPGPQGRHWYAITVLDSTLIVGSASLAIWSVLLAPVMRQTALSRAALTITFSATAVGLILVVAAVLLVAVRRPRSLLTLGLLGAAMAVMSLTMAAYLYLGAATNGAVPAEVHLGYLFSWLLMLLAAAVPPPARSPRSPPWGAEAGGAGTGETGGAGRAATAGSGLRPQARSWLLGLRAALPYLTFGATGALALVRLALGARIGDVEVYGLIGLLVLLVGRQLATIGENARLLALVERSRRELHQQAYHDPLTGVANRALFTERLERAVASHARDGRPLAVLYCDIDDFKQINDNLGHSVGDVLLRVVARRLQHGTQATDTVARLGGDEFAVVLDGTTDDPEAAARRLSCALRAPCQLAGRSYPVGISLGLVIAGPSNTGTGTGSSSTTSSLADSSDIDSSVTAESLLRDADIAMYTAKSTKQGGLVVHRAGAPTARSPVQLGGQLAAALHGEAGSGVLDIDYRRVVDLANGRTIALDARIRWIHPHLGPIHADRLVHLATMGGLSQAVDEFLLDRGCEDLAAGTACQAVLVSFSAGRAADPGLATDIIDTLARHELPADMLIPAFSTAAPADFGDVATARTVLTRLRGHGLRCALTDVTGDPAALRLLGRLPVDFLRLDGALTEPPGEEDAAAETSSWETPAGNPGSGGLGLGQRGGGNARTGRFLDVIRRALVAEAARHGLTVIAPGIRGEAQRRRLAADGCRLGEGPFYDRPLVSGAHTGRDLTAQARRRPP